MRLETVSEMFTETGISDVVLRLRRDEELDAEEIRLLDSDKNELIVETAGPSNANNGFDIVQV